jgi:uroporphyrinogen decarboxylase
MRLNVPQWQPAIYEHKAALIDRTPMEVACDTKLFVEAMLREHELYRSDFLTVGLDVYNIEAEALGAELTVPGSRECPDIKGHLFSLGQLPDELSLPEIPASGRFRMLLDVAAALRGRIGNKVSLRVAASGPVTLAAKLVGMEELILSLCMEDGRAGRLLAFATDVVERWLRCLRARGFDAVVFDSMAAPPMFSPDLFERVVLPLHQRLMVLLGDLGQVERELVIGGDTTPIASLLKRAGATILLCDYAANAAAFRAALGDDSRIRVRRNISPAALTSGDHEALAKEFAHDLSQFANPIAGTGILAYDFEPQDFLSFKQTVSELNA